MSPSARRAAAGFSLIEVLVAMTLTGLVLAAIGMVTAKWLPAWRRGLDRVQQSELLGLALDRMAADLSAAEFVPATVKTGKPLFMGTAGAVTFVRSALGPNAMPGLEVVELAPAGAGRAAALARRASPYGPVAQAQEAPALGPPVALLRWPFRISFSYAGRDGLWQDDWMDADTLPRAVRLVVRDAASGRALEASTAVQIRAEVPAACVLAQTDARLCGKPMAHGKEAEAEAEDDGPADGPADGAGEDEE
ncbi:type II secretion system protein J [Xanthobacter sp. AM11]|uniref:PulJ/GspJ family protein n=1 Tax=Xanthobacter sp. AM11 TaxID=3380643 RepID=UPI0039BEEB52